MLQPHRGGDGGDDDEGAFEKPALFKVGEESGVGLVEDGEHFVGLGEGIGVPVEAAVLDFNEADAVFDEAEGEKDAFREFFSSVSGASVGGFLGEVEGFEVL